jgi:hypothetical protein
MARTLDLYQLISQPESYRDDEWERAFLQSIVDAKVEIVSEEAQRGPDGWPYLFVKTSVVAKEPVARVLNWLSERGVGLAINPHKMMPDYIFTYGMIWNYRETGQFMSPLTSEAADRVTYKAEDKWVFGAPTEKYLPLYVRRVLRDFFVAQKLTPPTILVATSPDYKQTDLLVSLESLGEPPQAEHQRIAEFIGWFLPMHYSIVLANESGLPKFGTL